MAENTESQFCNEEQSMVGFATLVVLSSVGPITWGGNPEQ